MYKSEYLPITFDYRNNARSDDTDCYIRSFFFATVLQTLYTVQHAAGYSSGQNGRAVDLPFRVCCRTIYTVFENEARKETEPKSALPWCRFWSHSMTLWPKSIVTKISFVQLDACYDRVLCSIISPKTFRDDGDP